MAVTASAGAVRPLFHLPGDTGMSSLNLLVAFLVVVVTVQTVVALAYFAHRHPGAIQPLALALAGIAVMVAVVMPIAAR
ncbi:hypothetical protein AB0I75_35660 [Streptomyces sp. NPDC050273]|uniref:hypothetical protein n=1 Tax=Streptomyces sp. NPDC050273 TaxID=3154933 RepID=UPI00342C32D4